MNFSANLLTYEISQSVFYLQSDIFGDGLSLFTNVFFHTPETDIQHYQFSLFGVFFPDTIYS